MKKYDTVIFDLDGTLLDTLEDLMDSVNFALARYGFPSRTFAQIRDSVGNGVARLMELSIPYGMNNPLFQRCLEDFRGRYSTNMHNKTRPYPGVTELLEQLSNENYKLAVVSNKFDTAVKELCKLYFGNYINVAIGESPAVARKPAPDTVRKALAELGSTEGHAVYVGDSDVDVMTAHNAGLICVGVSWGFKGREILAQKGADCIIDRPEELVGIIAG